MGFLERLQSMAGSGPFESSDPPAPCAADGPVSPTGSVLEAVQCDTARYVALAPVAVDVNRTYLILSRADVDGTSLTYADVSSIPELQNALAHYGPRTESVRVLTHPGRRRHLTQSLEELDSNESRTFEYGGESFRLNVRLG